MAATDSAKPGCLSCEGNESSDLPPRDRVLRTEHWRAAHAFDAALAGWLVLVPTRHVTALDELRPDEVIELGPLLRGLSAALRAVTGCVKTYVLLMAEAEGFEHVHFHVVPRMADQPANLRGPRIFALLGVPPEGQVPSVEMDRIAKALQQVLSTSGGVDL